MGQYRIQSKSLGVDFLVEGNEAPNEKSTFEILKQVVPPDQMIKAFEDGNKELARAAYKNGYFDQDSDTGLYDAFKQAAGEVFEGLGNISKEVSLDFTASGAMTYGAPGIQKLVEGARVEQQKRRKKRKATGYQLLAETYGGYKSIGDAGKMIFSKMAGEGDEDIDASIEFIGDMMATQSFIDDGAAIMAEKFGDIDMYNDLKMGRVDPDKKQAMGGSLFVQLENPIAMVTTGGIRSASNLLRRGTAKKLAQDLQKAQSKQFLYSNQLNRLPADAPKDLVNTANDALRNATSEVNEILGKISPYAEQKAKAGLTNQAVGLTMQGLGKLGEYGGNLTEFIRRAGVEEATTLLMKTGLSENVSKAAIFGAIGAGTDLVLDGDPSAGDIGINALAAYLGPRALAAMGRSSAILGKQLTMAETSMPFFKRIGALPADNPKLAEVIVDRTDNLVLGDAASQLKPLISQARELPGSVRSTARFIDQSGLGRLGTETANVAKAAVGGAALPGAFGYMVGGEEGAASAIGASVPFIAAGLGYGSLLRFNNKSDLIAKQLGDLEYHKQSLSDTERANFESLNKDQQIAVSTFSQFFPDVVIKVSSMGKNGPNGAHYVDGSDSVIEINADKNSAWEPILSHEIGHHIERHGLLPNVLEELLGNPEKGKAGIFTKINKATGKPKIITDENGIKHYELSDEFRELQKTYIDKLAQSNVSEKSRQAYETPEQFARELFAEIVADRMLSGKTSKRAGQSSIYKSIESLGSRLTSGGFMRKVMHSLGMATKADGSLVQGTGILGKPFKSSKELDNLVKRYEDETIGLSESEIREQRPVTKDDELDTVIVSPNDPVESLQIFNNGGHFKTDKDGNIIVNPITKKPEVFSPSETRQANQALARDLTESIKARENDLPEGHVTLSETTDGKLTGSGKFIDDSIIDELSRTGRYNPSQINFLREASKAGREGIGNQMLLFYYAATGKGSRKYKTLKGGYRDSLVYGITITKDGNVILDTVSLDKLQKNIDFLLKRRGNEIAQAFGGSDPAVVRKNFESMFEKYLDNHAKGIVNGDSNPESGITDKQRDFLNAAFGPVSKSQIADNPTLSNLGERRANTLGTYRSRRLDRIGTLNPTGNTRNIVIDRIRRNLMPGRSEGDKLFIPAYHGTPHTFAAEPGAPLGRFRTSAIGTGEGAQAYGHGLYFAGKTDVADFYRQTLTQDQMFNDLDLKVTLNMRNFINMFRKNKNDVDFMRKHANRIKDDVSEQDFSELTRYIDHVEKNGHPKETGSLYKVELAPKENEYLLWDKPLSEQPKGVREKVKNLLLKTEDESGFDFTYGRPSDRVETGEEVYRGLVGLNRSNNPDAAASAALKEAGIPGIKYLDGSSRSKGEGDYNYVIFDEADVQITDKLFMPAGGMTVDQIKAKYPSVKLDIYGDAQKGFELSRIIVPKDERSSGLGTAVMDDIIKMADDQGAVISLTPDISFGGSSVSRLKKFYKKFGFVENKGRNKDFSTRNTMIRPASDKLFMPMSKDENLIKSLETKGHKFTGHPMLQAGQLIMDGKVVVELGTDFSGNLELAGIRALEKGAGIPALKSILNTAKENEMAVTGFAEAFGNTDPNAPKLSQERLVSLYKRLGGEINSYGKVVFNKEFLKKRRVKLKGFGDKLFMPASEAGAPRNIKNYRTSLWDEVKKGNYFKNDPLGPALYRSMSKSEWESLQKKGELKPVTGEKGIFVTRDVDRLVDGAYGGKTEGGVIAKIDDTETKPLKSRYANFEEDSIPSLKLKSVSEVWDSKSGENIFSRNPDKLFMPTEIQEGSAGSFFRPKSARDTSTQVRTFKSPSLFKGWFSSIGSSG